VPLIAGSRIQNAIEHQTKNDMKTNTDKTDSELKTDVISELKYEPGVRFTDIGVLVKDGAVTLNGFATSYGEKWDAVHATKRVSGVTAVADDIEVKLLDSQKRTDGDIAIAAINQLDWSTSIPKGTIGITVREGWVTLDGQVEWWYQKNAAGTAVQNLLGVKGIINLVTIKPVLTVDGVEKAIESAFKRNAQLDAEKIHVETNGSKVVLTGKVRNYAEWEEAERVAWAAPGVFSVDNQLSVKWTWFGQ
jgi:osmotically-inducible protein OsmY